MIRAFIGIPLPEELILMCLVAQGHLHTGRAVPRDNLHLTLLYLAEQPKPQLEDLAEELDAILHRPVPLRVTGFDVIGGFKGARHCVASVAALEPLNDLQAKTVRAARAVGIEIERRRFRPHITLVRNFKGSSMPPWDGQARDIFAPRFSLYQSTLKQDGAEYDSLADFTLTN